jgi:hypothetical protein
MRRVVTFELIDNDWLKEHLWKYRLEEIVSYYLLLCGIDSNHTQFTIGFPLYTLALSIVALINISWIQYCRKLCAIRARDFEGGENERLRTDCQKCKRRFCLKFCDG